MAASCDTGHVNLLRLLALVVALPGRLLLAGLERLGGPAPGRPLRALERPVRWSVHVFVWAFALVTVMIASAPPMTAVPAPTRPVVIESWTPRPTVAPATEPTPAPSPASDVPQIDVEDTVERDDDGEGWFCRRRRWC
jgi:hypothetical protein